MFIYFLRLCPIGLTIKLNFLKYIDGSRPSNLLFFYPSKLNFCTAIQKKLYTLYTEPPRLSMQFFLLIQVQPLRTSKKGQGWFSLQVLIKPVPGMEGVNRGKQIRRPVPSFFHKICRSVNKLVKKNKPVKGNRSVKVQRSTGKCYYHC